MDPRAACDLTMLALTIWREGRAESYEGKVAIAYSILNRVERPTWWGHTLLEVVTKRWQYSSITDPRDPQLTKWPTSYDKVWLECLGVASGALSHILANPAPGADSYYATYIKAPKWATDDKFVVQIGGHRFYDLDSDVERNLTST